MIIDTILEPIKDVFAARLNPAMCAIYRAKEKDEKKELARILQLKSPAVLVSYRDASIPFEVQLPILDATLPLGALLVVDERWKGGPALIDFAFQAAAVAAENTWGFDQNQHGHPTDLQFEEIAWSDRVGVGLLSWKQQFRLTGVGHGGLML